MVSSASIPIYDELASFIADRFATLRMPYSEWANLARQAIQGQPYDGQKLARLESFINEQRTELRRAVVIASEHFDDKQIISLREKAGMSKPAWKSLKNPRPVNLKDGFKLICF